MRTAKESLTQEIFLQVNETINLFKLQFLYYAAAQILTLERISGSNNLEGMRVERTHALSMTHIVGLS